MLNVNVKPRRSAAKALGTLLLCGLLAGCQNQAPVASAAPTQPTTSQPAPAQPTASLGKLYEISFRHVGSAAQPSSAARYLGGIGTQALQEVSGPVALQVVGVDTFVTGGVRHVRAVYSVTNNTGAFIDHLSFVPVNTDEDADPATTSSVTPTVGSTYFKDLQTYGNTDASARASALTPVAGKLLSAAQGAAAPDPEATPFIAVDTSALNPSAPSGLIINGMSGSAWRLPTALAPGASANVTFAADFVTDTPATDPFNFSVVVAVADDAEAVTLTPIHVIQGSTPAGDSPTSVTTPVTVRGVVTSSLQSVNQLGGFFIQDLSPDNDPTTSEGIFVYCGAATVCPTVSPGDLVQVSGTPVEFSGVTQLSNLSAVSVRASKQPLPAAAELSLPADTTQLERFEGMRVHVSGPLTVTDNYNYGRYGQLGLSVGGRVFNPTNGNDTYTAAQDTLREVVLDDGVSAQNPPTLRYGNVRTGATLSELSGVWHQNPGGYMLEPEGALSFSDSNPRLSTPAAVGGTLRVAGANVLNYFTDLNPTYSSSGPRGANTPAELSRQRTKMANALTGLNPDVLTLMEVQNNGDITLKDIVEALNEKSGAGTYAAVQTGTVGTDAIKVAIIYKPANVTPVGTYQIDNNAVYSRPPVAQTFRDNNGGVFTVVANHLKSKGSCPTSGDVDKGQGCWNTLRVQQAGALMDFVGRLKQSSQDPDVLLLGDFNAYGDEDPIKAIVAGSAASGTFESLNKRIPAADRYSYQFSGQFGYLDHALASSSMSSQVSGITEWHINSDEPTTADYNLEYKNVPGCVVDTPSGNKCTGADLFDPATPFRASDHDPVLVGLNLTVSTAPVTPSITLSAADLSVPTGQSVSGAITMSRVNYSGDVTLSVTGVSGSTPAPVVSVSTQPGSSNAGNLIIDASSAAPGEYTVNVSGSGAGVAPASTTFKVTVRPPQSSGLNHLVISQVYGGGGNTGAPFSNDFIEVFNPTSAEVDLSNYSVQYGAAGNTTWALTPLNGVLPAGGYYLVQEAKGSGSPAALPNPDASGTLNLSGTTGKVALVSNITALSGANPAGTAGVVDLVGFGTPNGYEGSGAATGASNQLAIFRKSAGCTDTDNNAADFEAATPAPRNSVSPKHNCP